MAGVGWAFGELPPAHNLPQTLSTEATALLRHHRHRHREKSQLESIDFELYSRHQSIPKLLAACARIMADNKVGGPGENQPTMTEYKKSQARVRDLIEKRRMLDRRLVRETQYGRA